jgi:hypothetical protein
MTTTKEHSRPLLDLIDGREQDEAATRAALHRMLNTTERALDAVGIGRETVAGRLMRYVVRVAGLGVLTRTVAELAMELGCDRRTVFRARESLGDMLAVGEVVHGRKRVGLALRAKWTSVVELSENSSTRIRWLDACNNPPNRVVASMVTPVVTPMVASVVTPVVANMVTPVVANMVTPVVASVVTFRKTSLLRNSLIRYRYRYRLKTNSKPAAAAAENQIDSKHSIAAESICQAYPAHQRQEANNAVWLLAYVAIVASEKSGLDQVKILRDQIRTKQISSPSNYALMAARGLCQDEQLNFHELRARCPPAPKREPVKAIEPVARLPMHPPPSERATPLTAEQRAAFFATWEKR